jgi:hypothetical protein
MGAQFTCGSANRRIRITQPTWDGKILNGIDYLEVVDHDAPLGYPPQQTLLVKLFQPVPATLDAKQVKITGGVRYPHVGVVWAVALTAGPINDDPQYYTARYPTAADQARVLVVRTDSFGDFSSYTLSLQLKPESEDPPDGFDRQLSSVDFSFKVECPQELDCQPVDDCPPIAETPPAIDYLAKDYGSFRRVIVDRISSLSPNWPERNPADAGMVVADLLAWAGDQLSYYQDAVATEAYLGTARRRLSVRRHARLLDYRMHEGANARALVCVEVDKTIGPAGVLLPRVNPDQSITTFMTEAGSGVRLDPDPSALNLLVLEKSPRLFEPMHDALLFRSHNSIDFYTWGDDSCCLPEGATRATLVDNEQNRLVLMAGDVLIFEEKKGRVTGKPGDADPTRRQAVRLTKVSPTATRPKNDASSPRAPGELARDPLTGTLIVEIEWHVDDALTQPLCISTPTLTSVSAASGNVVLVDDGRTLSQKLSPASFDEPRRYRPRLDKPEVTHAVPLAEPTSPRLSASATLTQDPHATVPSVALTSSIGNWQAQPDLLGSDGTARDLVVEMDEGGYAELRFGDGMLGEDPVANMTAAYRVGRGLSGNVGPETIVQVMTSATGLQRVRNPLAATGGADPESLDEVKQYAPQAFRVQERAVTEADYAECAQRHPEVLRAVATRRWTGSWYTVFLTVERAHGLPLDEPFRDEITGFIEQFRLAGEDLEIEPPIYVPLKLVLVVCVARGYFRDKIEQELKKVFSTGTRSDGKPAFFAPDQFTFGQPVYLSQVIAAAMSVAGVDWVDPTDPAFVFQRANEVPAGEIALGYLAMNRLEIAQCESSRSAPENGQITFIVNGGQ